SYLVTVGPDWTQFRPADIADSPDLSAKLSVRQRMYSLLRRGAMTPEDIAAEIDADGETVKRTIRRYKNEFVVIDGGRVGLHGRTAGGVDTLSGHSRTDRPGTGGGHPILL